MNALEWKQLLTPSPIQAKHDSVLAFKTKLAHYTDTQWVSFILTVFRFDWQQSKKWFLFNSIQISINLKIFARARNIVCSCNVSSEHTALVNVLMLHWLRLKVKLRALKITYRKSKAVDKEIVAHSITIPTRPHRGNEFSRQPYHTSFHSNNFHLDRCQKLPEKSNKTK